jgi:aminoglycoside phosphotransferase (APT) family kinase protein
MTQNEHALRLDEAESAGPGNFDDIVQALRRRFGQAARMENIVVPTLGGSNRTVLFDLVEGSAKRRMVSRQETYSGKGSPFLSPEDQFRIMGVAFRNQLPVPEPIFAYDAADGMGAGFVTAFVEGETMPKRILGPAFTEIRPKLTVQLAEFLARLNAIDSAEFAFLEKIPDSADPIAAQRAHYETYAELHPAIELGFRWLERNRPPAARRVLVHGDFRNGNFMVGPNGLTAVLDWECSHIGAAAEDMGWLCTRSWRFGQFDLPVGGFSQREALFDAYRAAGGDPIDPEAVRYWEIFGLLRWAVINMMQAYGHVEGGRRSVVFAACGRNASLIEYDLLMTIAGKYQ